MNGQVQQRVLTNGNAEKHLNNNVTKPSVRGQWGRAWNVDYKTLLGAMFVLFVCPLMPLLMHTACGSYECSISSMVLDVWTHTPPFVLPSVSMYAVKAYFVWMGLQLLLSVLPDIFHHLVPRYTGGMQSGAVTPSGRINHYNINGLQAWLICHVIWFLNVHWLKLFKPSIVFDHVTEFMIIANIAGYSLATFVYIKGRCFPTHENDCKSSGNILYDYLMGVEFNPRIGDWFDFKLFFNGRPGIVAWTIINLSFRRPPTRDPRSRDRLHGSPQH
uniref:7-dehydrocholesterol reductase n=1 Tax=Ciona savignyi TaxID=51511 RepID=H2YFT3_CIOSA